MLIYKMQQAYSSVEYGDKPRVINIGVFEKRRSEFPETILNFTLSPISIEIRLLSGLHS